MAKPCGAHLSGKARKQVEVFGQNLFQEAEEFLYGFLPQKIIYLNQLLREDSLNVADMTSLQPHWTSPCQILHPRMMTWKQIRRRRKKSLRKVLSLLTLVKPEVWTLKEKCILVITWIQHLIPRIEDGNDLGVAIQEKVLERMNAIKTKVEAFQTTISKCFSERGDAVAKASQETPVMDYRRDEAACGELRAVALDLRAFCAELYRIMSSNLEKTVNPKGEEKPSMY
uniref:Proteasome activator complex subunit 2 n=1 Tax=Saimiri boliviensis boliviensis TaxID=39432 RepID=A0A2K6TCE3_SAIBB